MWYGWKKVHPSFTRRKSWLPAARWLRLSCMSLTVGLCLCCLMGECALFWLPIIILFACLMNHCASCVPARQWWSLLYRCGSKAIVRCGRIFRRLVLIYGQNLSGPAICFGKQELLLPWYVWRYCCWCLSMMQLLPICILKAVAGES